MKLPYSGLSFDEVEERKRAGLYNKSVAAPSKSVGEIIRSNTLTYFNFVFLVIATILIMVGAFYDLTFLPIVIANSLIGIVQELRAKYTLDKLRVLNAPVVRVVREGKLQTVPVEELVVDDIVKFKGGDQLPADAELLEGEVAVNESLLTGEADDVMKKAGDELLSGSFVVYGECYAKVTKVGAEAYANQLTLRAKAIKTGEQSEIIRGLNRFVKIAGVAIIPIGAAMFIEEFFCKGMSAQHSVQAMVAAIIGMIPEGLFLLASATLVISAMRLARQKVLLHDMKSIEMLARVDTLCVDKTGTITSAEMDVLETEWIGAAKDERKKKLAELISEVVATQKADSETMVAMQKEFKASEKMLGEVKMVQGFSSRYKYSGTEFSKGVYVIGAPTMVLGEGYEKYRKAVEVYTKKGLRVLVFGAYAGHLKANQGLETKKVEALALIVLQNRVRETAPATFRYFVEQGVEVKVISGDDEATVAEVARQAGIPNAERSVDLSQVTTDTELKKLALTKTVFGRVSPQQKRELVKYLKEAGRTVAMTGDGVNDVLALKDADCSVAMASGAQAAVQASQIVLIESDFAKMPEVVAEGRRVVNNLERSGSLFLVKNIFSFTAALLAIGFAISYPMLPRHVSLVTMWTIGVPSFLLAQIPNRKLIKGDFLANIIKAALPAALAILLAIMGAVIVGQRFGFSKEVMGTLCVMVWSVVGLMNIARLCWPFNKWTAGIWMISFFGIIFCLLFLKGIFSVAGALPLAAWMVFGVVTLLAWPLLKLGQVVTDKILGLQFLSKVVNVGK